MISQELLDAVKALAKEAGREIHRIYKTDDFGETEKADESPLTKADLAANEIIMKGLATLTQDLIVSEEGVLPKSTPAKFWLVDPLDGTRDFIARKDSFCVCIALVEHGQPTLGVIHAPVTDELYWAVKGQGAFKDGKPLKNTRVQTKDFIAVGSRSIPSDRMKLLYDVFSIAKVDRFGSALKFCKMAEGLYDVYPRFGPMMEWDTAAGQIIAEEAGCKVIDINTQAPLIYGKPGLENRGFLCSRQDLQLEREISRFLASHR